MFSSSLYFFNFFTVIDQSSELLVCISINLINTLKSVLVWARNLDSGLCVYIMATSSFLSGKAVLVVSPFLFALAIIIAKLALNDGVQVHAFNALRNSLAFLFTYIFRNRKRGSELSPSLSNCDHNFVFWSVLCGLCNALGMTSSAVALAHLNTAMFSFMLGLTVVMTPLLGHFLPFKSTKLNTLGWFAVCLSVVGTLLLEGCIGDMASCFEDGNWYSGAALGAALFYSLYSYFIGLGSESVEASLLTQGALCVSCMALTAVMVLFIYVLDDDKSSNNNTSSLFLHFNYSSRQLMFTVGVAALEAVAWQYETYAVVAVGASKAAMAIATEAPMTTLLAYLILNESLSQSEYLGCAMVFLAAVIASWEGGDSGDKVVGNQVDLRQDEDQIQLLDQSSIAEDEESL